jgi:hypothetical protein
MFFKISILLPICHYLYWLLILFLELYSYVKVNWDTVRVLKNGETVSIDGTHLGHNLPDAAGRRYCINLVSIAGNPTEQTSRRRSDL